MPKIIELSGVVGYEITAKGLKNRLPKDGSDVLLKVDSVGGSVFEGNRLYNAINDYDGKIEVELGAIAASAASYFPLAAGIENIRVRKNTTFMGHKAWTIMLGNADDMKAEAEILDGFDLIIAKVYAKATGKDVDSILEDMKNEFWLIGGESVVDAGFAAGIVEDDDSEMDSESGEGESEESEIVEKAQIQALIKEAKNKLKTQDIEEDLDKWAARIHAEVNKTDVTEDGQALLFSESAPSGAKNKKEEFKMTRNEFFEQNPEAKAENESAMAQAVSDAVAADRERGKDIFALYGVNDSSIKAYENGVSVSELAVEEKRKEVEARKEARAQDLGGLEPKNQVPKKETVVNKDEDKLSSSLEERFNKKAEAFKNGGQK